jgi:hypothetical protein
MEELVIATNAVEMLRGNGRWAFHYQYHHYCGGCTGVAGLGLIPFRLLGLSLPAWKLVPIGLTCAILWSGARLLERTTGRPAAVAWCVLLILSPTVIAQTMHVGWGGHFESMAFALPAVWIAAGLPDRPERRGAWAAMGLLCGIGLWFSVNSAFVAPVILVALATRLSLHALRRGLPWAVAGGLLGLTPNLLFYAAVGRSPLGNLLTHASVDHSKLEKLGEATFASFTDVLLTTPHGVLGGGLLVLLGLWGAVAAAARRPLAHRLPLLLLVAAIALYLVAPFRVDRSFAGPPWYGALRYLTPAGLCWLLAAAAGVGSLWSEGGRRRILAAVLLGAIAIPGGVARGVWIQRGAQVPDRTPVVELLPYDYPEFVSMFVKRAPSSVRWVCDLWFCPALDCADVEAATGRSCDPATLRCWDIAIWDRLDDLEAKGFVIVDAGAGERCLLDPDGPTSVWCWDGSGGGPTVPLDAQEELAARYPWWDERPRLGEPIAAGWGDPTEGRLHTGPAVCGLP